MNPSISQLKELSNEELTIRVAAVLGVKIFKSCGEEDNDHKHTEDEAPNSIGAWVRWCHDCDAEKICSIHGDERFWRIRDREDHPDAPNYPEDLNAMHKAEKTLSDEEFFRYIAVLRVLVEETYKDEYDERYTVIASARDRAIAFLAVRGREG